MNPAPSLPADLLQRIARGDVNAFGLLYRDMAPRLCSYMAKYVRDEALAEDLTQQLFLDLWRSRGKWKIHSGLRAYLFASARNRALNARRRHSVEDDWEENATANPDLEGAIPRHMESADLRLVRQEAEDELHQAMALLPERCRMAMYLRWQEGLSYAELADVMGISAKGVEKLLARGMSVLRTTLG